MIAFEQQNGVNHQMVNSGQLFFSILYNLYTPPVFKLS